MEALLGLAEDEETTVNEFRISGAEQDAENQVALNALFRLWPLAGGMSAANEIEYGSEAEALRIRESLLRIVESIGNFSISFEGEEIAAMPPTIQELLDDMRAAIALRFPEFNSVTDSAIERRFDEETHGALAFYETSGVFSQEGLDFFLTDNGLFDGYVAAGQNVRTQRQVS